MAPFLETVKLVTVSFACSHTEELTSLMSSVGSGAFSPVINDIQGNITVVRERHDATPSQSGTLEVLVTNEKSNKANPFSKQQSNPSEDLKVAFTKGYNVTLGPIHRGSGIFSIQGAIMRAAGLMFNTAIGYCPPRKSFYEKLAANPNGEPCSQEVLDKQLNDWITGLDTIITRMDKFYTKGKHGEIFKSA
ncbi:glycolipid transfer protein [Suillus fuscotomentosus]|uniref:Glycolipid transfer protein n=1 Tax=Suillus fuscotomentosus TaxID=1912939 RepID=A0AAD4EET7_9AGAM|nr:glycolipid transfer protein [Suillus fuscotomentosus]KAG1904930.1 glycolipid transfer protein [Suillus fuscotomentosus]